MDTNPHNTNLINAKDVSKILGISKAHSYVLISTGQLRSVRFGKTIRIRPQDLSAFIEQNLTGQDLQKFPFQNPSKNS